MAKKIASVKKLPSTVTLDYPLEHELVRRGHYTIRLTALAGVREVQVRIDAGAWGDCRQSVGHFWYDWMPVPGTARLQARSRRGKARWAVGPSRTCRVS